MKKLNISPLAESNRPEHNSSPAPKSGSGAALSWLAIVAFLGGGAWWVTQQMGKKPPQEAAAAAEAIPLVTIIENANKPATPTPTAPAPTAPTVVVPQPTAPITEVTPVPMPEETAAPTISAELSAKLDEKAPELPLVGMDATKRDVVAFDKQLIIDVAREGAWDPYRLHLQRSLTAAYKKLPTDGNGRNRFQALWEQPSFYQAFLRWRVLTLLPSELITKDGYEGGMFFTWLLERNEIMEEILLTINPQKDELPQVTKLLFDAWQATAETHREKYINLAIACAVVFDRDQAITTPSEDEKYGESTTIKPLARYRWYMEKNEAGKLTAPVHHSSARDLVWVVCAPVSTKELDWAIAKMNISRRNWGNAYGMIEYLMERAVNGLNPYKEYTFAEILKEGGICGDQSYFCVNTARAHGIPAMVLSGETDLGGHAWAGVKVKDDEWSTMVGRIGGAANGKAGNPQTGGDLSEQEVWLWNDRTQQSRPTTITVFRHLWLADFFDTIGDAKASEETIRLSLTPGRMFSETWSRLHDILVKKTAATADPSKPEILNEWIEFVDTMRDQFKENPRMAALAADAESKYIFPYAKEEDARRSLMRERRRIEREAGEQKDLIADSLKREADLLFKNGEGGDDARDKISRLYDRALRDYGGSITGFKQMAENYFAYMKDDPITARKAARDIELAFQRVVETGSKDWFRANTETSIYKMICSYYRTAGDEKKAEKLETRYERLLRDAERGAL